MFGGTSEQDKKDLAAAQAKAKVLGITPTISTSVSVYDSLADGGFKIHVSKGVSGTYEEDAAPTFTFTATATGDNAELAPKLSDVTITGAGEKISAQFTYSKDDESVNSAQFNNTYTAPKPDSTTASIKVTKTVNGGTEAADKEFPSACSRPTPPARKPATRWPALRLSAPAPRSRAARRSCAPVACGSAIARLRTSASS